MIPLYQVDAFTDTLFRGNPAAVCPLDNWLSDDLMQRIAAENNLSETAFFVGKNGRYRLRWFTPACEVDLCGHATLATSWVIFNRLGDGSTTLRFETRSGELVVKQQGELIAMDFPAQPSERVDIDSRLSAALGKVPGEVWVTDDVMVVYPSQADIESIQPDSAALALLPYRGIIVTAPGDDCDFVSRFFGPAVGVDEDPVTGSAHCKLAPYWSERLGKTGLQAKQLSQRGGRVSCHVNHDRVTLSGAAVEYLQGQITVDRSES